MGNKLGNFDLSGIPPAPRGMPQIEVSFNVSADGLLTVNAKDKASGKAKSITISSHDGRLSEEDIKRMIEETTKFAEQDRIHLEKVAAKNALENTTYGVRNQLNGELKDKLSSEDNDAVSRAVNETIEWIDANDSAEKEEFEAKQKELEAVVHPVISKMYQQQQAGGQPTPGAAPQSNEGPRVEEVF